ncbi:MAG: DMT family transporter [Anaerolineales bacterium]|jgi:drug/metabolite transporter (DMT)-like permease
MFLPANLLGIFLALTSAFVWGSGDFSGGLAARRSHQFQVLALSTLSGIFVLLIFAGLWHEALPSLRSDIYAMLAGVSGALGIAALYRALSLGNTAIVAPTAAVIGAALPVGFGILTAGMPAALQLVGFILAFIGIWLVSRSSTPGKILLQHGFVLACLAGVSFGGFFILIAQVEAGKVFNPLVVARGMEFVTALVLLRLYRMPLTAINSNPTALLAGVLDVGGNIFYLLANQYTRLEVAAVLASMYPLVTVILASLVLKERVSPNQWLGVVACLAAIALITV